MVKDTKAQDHASCAAEVCRVGYVSLAHYMMLPSLYLGGGLAGHLVDTAYHWHWGPVLGVDGWGTFAEVGDLTMGDDFCRQLLALQMERWC